MPKSLGRALAREPHQLGEEAQPFPTEHDMVTLLRPQSTTGGHLPKGAVGTVVEIWAPGEAYEVEFDTPVRAVVTVAAADLTLVRHAS